MTCRGLRLERVKIDLRGRRLVSVDTLIAPGEILTVMGPSGSGKSTLLAAAIGTLDPAFRVSGRMLLDGCDVTLLPPHARRIGILFQDDILFPHLSVAGNLAFGLRSEIRGRHARRVAIEAALTEAELGGFADRDPATLSGGQRARVALLRTLLSSPRALLLDEPFSKLDADLRVRMRHFVFRHAKSRSLPVLMVTHDQADAEAAGGAVLRPLDGLS